MRASRSVVSTLCDPMDCSPPGSAVHGILQARILEWIAISFSRGVGIEPRSPALRGRFFTFFITEPPGKALGPKEKILKYYFIVCIFVYSRVFFDLPGKYESLNVKLAYLLTWNIFV